jgi:hypothetical protein
MTVKVTWETGEYTVEELGLPTLVDMPTMNEDEIADYLSEKYNYCIDNIISTEIVGLDNGYWFGETAWVLEDDGSEVILLTGNHTLTEALISKEHYDNYEDDYDNCIVWSDAEEWLKQQELKK